MKAIFNFTSFVTFQEEAKRIRGKRGRGASGKTPVFGMLKQTKVYT